MSTIEVPPPAAVDQQRFREVVGHFTTGVAVVTARDGDQRYGVTASAVASLSIEPPMLLVCLNRRLATCTAIAAARAFSISILGEEQDELALQFATRHPDKFRGVELVEGRGGAPLIAGALAHLECRLHERVDAATHAILLGEVLSARAGAGRPLTYFRGGFGRFADALDETALQEIRKRVLDRRLALGRPIDAAALAGELDCPRPAVHHALRRLVSEGLLTRRACGDYEVTPLTVASAWQAYDARAAIECGVVEQVAGSLEAAQIDTLRAAAQATAPWIADNAFVDFDRYLATNQAFHEIVVGLTRNQALLHGYRAITMGGVMSRALRGVRRSDDRFISDHLELVEALAAGDAAAARRIVRAHAELGKQRVRIAIEAVGGRY